MTTPTSAPSAGALPPVMPSDATARVSASGGGPGRSIRLLLLVGLWLFGAVPGEAQIIETVGSRALGMGGAFVGVANDSTATWWNPAGLAAGPFLDISLARASTARTEELPGWRHRASWFAAGTPPFGLSYYRLRLTDVAPVPAGEPPPGGVSEALVRSIPVGQFGVTLVHTLVDGLHLGGTVKYVRGTYLSVIEPMEGGLPVPDERIDALLRRGTDLDGGRAQHRFDVDAGIMGVRGPFRAGAVMKNLRRPRFGDPVDAVTLPRQGRVGISWDGSVAQALPVVVALDVDVVRYDTMLVGPRRVVALGGEGWLFERLVGLRAGARFNTIGARDRAATFGGSFAARTGMYVEGHLVRGGAAGEQGWGLAARVTF